MKKLWRALNGIAISLIRWFLVGSLICSILWMAGLAMAETWELWKVVCIGFLIDFLDWMWPHLRSRPRWF